MVSLSSLDLTVILFTELRMNKTKSVEQILLSYINRKLIHVEV
uniref:Uncharacterized protein n=1 Tax=virus sp. ctx9V1 TaxID=2828001 RepID=A0A8S5RE57_9VIRU|nr:MAG TPA: hypothetical protein [virus sp. ctx9V1]